ncbi:hypothetical protein CTAYLR_001323 [Chrysophaeum taylorii]|uniref:Importin N-terminal domain-containing protein n=1 Tax=Chrysophaeum taylorii TaxID=2483200 RepID=A0AAD7XES0_9STRA|nr:hypothetical protein CTAYLR_001323 [Chrysophaeum taylorii]
MEAILSALLHPDTRQIKQAEEALKPVLKKAGCVPALMYQLEMSGNPAVRQIAAVVLRKKIVKMWRKLKKTTQQHVKEVLLARLANEPERAVRKSIAALSSSLARVLLPGGRWNELLQFISQCASHASPAHRELAHLLLLQLSETVARNLTSQVGELARLFASALGDQDRSVSVMALRACCAFVATLSTDDEALLFRDLVPPMVTVARQAAEARDDVVLQAFFDAFAELAQTPVPVIAPHATSVVQLLLDVMRAPEDLLDRQTRDGAAHVLGTLAEWKPKLVGKQGLVPGIVEACVMIMARTDSSKSGAAGALFMSTPLQRLKAEEEALLSQQQQQQQQVEKDGEYEGPSPQEMAQTTLDQIALHVPLKWSLEPTLGLAARCLGDPEQATRRAGAAAIGVVAEGFQDALREKHLGQVLRLLEEAAARSDAATRECLCFAYGQLAEHCQPEIVAYAASVLPVVFAFLDDSRAAVVGTSCYVLEMFCESMDAGQIMPLLDPLMQRLLALLGHQLLGIREMAAAAVGSAAVAAGEKFGPYLDGAAGALGPNITLTDERAWELRGRSLEALGHIALAVGPERFQPIWEPALASATSNLSSFDSTELAEYSYGFFANVAKVMRTRFSPLLPQLVPHLIEVIARRDGASFKFEEEDDDGPATGEGGDGPRMAFLDDDDDGGIIEREEGGADDEWEDDPPKPASSSPARATNDDDDDDDDDLAGQAVLQVRTALMNVKKAAIVALGNAAEYTEGAFAGYLDQAYQVLKEMTIYFHHEIRERCAIALQQLVHAACVARAGPALADAYREGLAAQLAFRKRKEPRAIKWTKGDATARLPDAGLATFADECVGLLIKLVDEDESKEVVAIACEALVELAQDVGPAALIPSNHHLAVADQVVRLAKGEATCQTLLNADDDDYDRAILGVPKGEDDHQDHDNVLMDNVADLCGTLGKVAGGAMGPAKSAELFQAFAKYVAPHRSSSDRAMAIGCYAELCSELPPEYAALQHFATLHPLLVQACADTHANVARNAAFGLGSLFANAPALARPHAPAALQTLWPLIERAKTAPPERKDADQAASDNAVASMCRIISIDFDSAPVDQVLALILPLLPLQEDASENKTVYTCLLRLIDQNHAALANHAPLLQRAIAQAVDQAKIDDDHIASLVAQACARFPPPS